MKKIKRRSVSNSRASQRYRRFTGNRRCGCKVNRRNDNIGKLGKRLGSTISKLWKISDAFEAEEEWAERKGRGKIASKVKSGRTPCHFQTQPAKITRSNLGFVIFFPASLPLFCARPIKNIARNRSKTGLKTEQSKLLRFPHLSFLFLFASFCMKQTSMMTLGNLYIYLYIIIVIINIFTMTILYETIF